MRMFSLCIVLILTATILSLANSESINHLEIQNNHDKNMLLSNGKLFHESQNSRIHIDFGATNEKLVNIQIQKNNILILQDGVSDLSKNVIYEIHLAKYGKGEYTITVTTSLKRKIAENFMVP